MKPLQTLASWTHAALNADEGMKVPDGLMSFAKDTRGKPPVQQRTLYLAAVSFGYAVWENYVEDLAIELTALLAENLPPERIPTKARELITKDSTPWELSVHPGWKGLWVSRIEQLAKGDEGSGRWGLNTASFENVALLFEQIGLDVLPRRLTEPKPDTAGQRIVPTRINITSGELDVRNALRQLINVRGEAVHTARTTDPLLKREVQWWSQFVHDLYEAADKKARDACADLLGD